MIEQAIIPENTIQETVEEKFDLLNIDSIEYKTKLTKKFMLRKPYQSPNPKKIMAFMPGSIQKIYVKEGDVVKEGDKLIVHEAMKMKNDITSPIKGKIKKILIKTGDLVAKNQLLIEFK